MTKDNDLVKRLRAVDHLSVEDCFLQSPLYGDAAHRIEELEAENNRLKEQCKGLAQAAMNNGQGLIIAEAKLAKAVEALRSIAANTCCTPCQEAALVARATLAEIEGDKT